VEFNTTAGDILKIFTTRPDTLFGATYMVMSPEHELIDKWASRLSNLDAVNAYRQEAAKKSDFDRTEVAKEKTGVKLEGVMAVNPVNGTQIPIYIADYVLTSYGTGAIMAVPAHDTRDWEFAKKFGLPIIEVVKGGDVQNEAFTDCYTGVMVNSGFLDGMTVEEAKKAITAWLSEHKKGEPKVNFKLRDWVFSRQRYWGEPIPIVICEKLRLCAAARKRASASPAAHRFLRADRNGRIPLAKIDSWVNTTCPHCGGPAKRETDTMPSGQVPHGTSCATATPTAQPASPPRRRSIIGCLWIGTMAAWSTPRCTCFTPASGISFYTISAWFPPRALRQTHQPRHDTGRKRRKDEQIARQRGKSRRYY
jgi:leucyl-tRNA synthetase